jgi:glutamate 5-kinase
VPSILVHARRLVIKVGSSLVTNQGHGLDHAALAQWAEQIAELKRRGRQVLLVSSGAVAEGMQRLGWRKRPRQLHELQAAAAVGQMGLVQAYESCFRTHGLHAAQILLTHEDLADRKRYLNARSTLRSLLELDTIPIINENDTVATEEIKFGDNDQLAALVCNLVSADALVILTDVEGVRDAAGVRMPIVRDIDREAAPVAGGSTSGVGSGGMASKVGSARIVTRTGVPAIVAPGREPDVIVRVLAGVDLGTLFVPAQKGGTGTLSSRKHWIAYGAKPEGRLVVDDGAVKALREGGKSLLPAGIKEVHGDFELGETVSVVTTGGSEIARGLVAYPAADLRRISGLQSAGIEARLGYKSIDEAIHRDDLVIL